MEINSFVMAQIGVAFSGAFEVVESGDGIGSFRFGCSEAEGGGLFVSSTTAPPCFEFGDC